MVRRGKPWGSHRKSESRWKAHREKWPCQRCVVHLQVRCGQHPLTFSLTLPFAFSPFSFFLFSHFSFSLFLLPLLLFSPFSFFFLPLFLFPLFSLPLLPQFLFPLHGFPCLPGSLFLPHPPSFFIQFHLFVDALRPNPHPGNHSGVQVRPIGEARVQGMRSCSGCHRCGRVVIGRSQHRKPGIHVDGRIVVRQGRSRVEHVAWNQHCFRQCTCLMRRGISISIIPTWWQAGNRAETGVRIHRKGTGRVGQPFVRPVRLESATC